MSSHEGFKVIEILPGHNMGAFHEVRGRLLDTLKPDQCVVAISNDERSAMIWKADGSVTKHWAWTNSDRFDAKGLQHLVEQFAWCGGWPLIIGGTKRSATLAPVVPITPARKRRAA